MSTPIANTTVLRGLNKALPPVRRPSLPSLSINPDAPQQRVISDVGPSSFRASLSFHYDWQLLHEAAAVVWPSYLDRLALHHLFDLPVGLQQHEIAAHWV